MRITECTCNLNLRVTLTRKNWKKTTYRSKDDGLDIDRCNVNYQHSENRCCNPHTGKVRWYSKWILIDQKGFIRHWMHIFGCRRSYKDVQTNWIQPWNSYFTCFTHTDLEQFPIFELSKYDIIISFAQQLHFPFLRNQQV